MTKTIRLRVQDRQNDNSALEHATYVDFADTEAGWNKQIAVFVNIMNLPKDFTGYAVSVIKKHNAVTLIKVDTGYTIKISKEN